MIEDGTAFWMVWSPEGRPPTHRHESRNLALTEAERLARANPGQEFFVLEATHMRTLNDMKRVSLEQPIPF